MFHKIILAGNLGRDPEMRFTPSGVAVTNLNVATNRVYTNASGEQIKETLWFRVSVWGKQAEACQQYLSKGRQVSIQGSLKTDVVVEGDDRRYYTKVVADPGGVIYLGSNGSASQVSQTELEEVTEAAIPF